MTPLELDHLVFATPDLEATVAWFTEASGVVPTEGGRHVGLGTRNHLVGLGDGAYLEIVGPDPEQDEPRAPRPFGIDDLEQARLVTWAWRGGDLDARVAAANDAGLDVGSVISMQRATPDGELLQWQLTVGAPASLGPIQPVPFLIDWGDTPHPTATLDHPVGLDGIVVTAPDVSRVAADWAALSSIDETVPGLELLKSDLVKMVASLRTPAGRVILD